MLLRCSLQQLHGTFDFNGMNPLTLKALHHFIKYVMLQIEKSNLPPMFQMKSSFEMWNWSLKIIIIWEIL